jgi:hypothetical protein
MDYSIHGKLNLRADVNLGIPPYFKKAFNGKPDLEISKGSANAPSTKPVFPPYIFFEKNILMHKYGFFVPCRLTLSNLEGKTKIEFTELYSKLLDLKDIANCVMNFKLLQAGLVKMHGSCVELSDKTGLMIAGWDHSGKSTLALKIVDAGAKFLADDTTFLSHEYAYAYPKTIKAFRGLHFLAKRLNTVPLVNRILGINKRVQPKNITEKARVKYVFISRYGEKNIRVIDTKEAAKTMELLNIYITELFDKRHLVLEYCHYNKYDLPKLLKSRHDIIEKFLKGVKCFELMSTNVEDSEDLINKTIG